MALRARFYKVNSNWNPCHGAPYFHLETHCTMRKCFKKGVTGLRMAQPPGPGYFDFQSLESDI